MAYCDPTSIVFIILRLHQDTAPYTLRSRASAFLSASKAPNFFFEAMSTAYSYGGGGLFKRPPRMSTPYEYGLALRNREFEGPKRTHCYGRGSVLASEYAVRIA